MNDSEEENWEDALSEFEENTDDDNETLEYYNKINPKIIRKSLFTLPEFTDVETVEEEEKDSQKIEKKYNENKKKSMYLNDIRNINERAKNLANGKSSSSTLNEIDNGNGNNRSESESESENTSTSNNFINNDKKASIGNDSDSDSDSDYLPIHRNPPIDLRNEKFGTTENLMKNSDSQETLNELDEIEKIEKEIDNLLKCTPEELEKLKESAKILKEAGNQYFKRGEYKFALNEYKKASEICPSNNKEDIAIYYNNMAACYMHIGTNEDVKTYCDKALENNPDYIKALIRRANVCEKIGKVYSISQAIEDHKKILLLDPSYISSEATIRRLQKVLVIQQEKEKEEMLEKFKDVGNKLLGKLGLSLDNFKLQQNETGGYSINMNN